MGSTSTATGPAVDVVRGNYSLAYSDGEADVWLKR